MSDVISSKPLIVPDAALAAAVLANKVGEKIGFLFGFLNRITLSTDKAQTIDFEPEISHRYCCQINGIPGDSIGIL